MRKGKSRAGDDLTLPEWIARLYALIPAWFVAVMFTVAGISMLMRFWAQRNGHYLPRPWAAIGLAGSLLAFAVFYTAISFGNETLSQVIRSGISRPLAILLCASILHLNIDYIRLALRGDDS